METKKMSENIVSKYSKLLSPHVMVSDALAKKSALIAIDEIISFIDNEMKGWLDSDIISYLEQVKIEIENK